MLELRLRQRLVCAAAWGLALAMACQPGASPGDGDGDGDGDEGEEPFRLLTARPDGSAGAGATHSVFALTRDARFVFFLGPSDAGYTDEDEPAGLGQVLYRKDLTTQETRVVSRDETGAVLGGVEQPSVSDDGRFVAFRSDRPFVARDENDRYDAFRIDVETGEVHRISEAAGGGDLAGAVSSPVVVLAADGQAAVFNYDGGDADITLPPTQMASTVLSLTFLWTPDGRSLLSRVPGQGPPDTPCVEPAGDRDLSHVAVINRGGLLSIADDDPSDDDVLLFSTAGIALVDEEAGGLDLRDDIVDGSLSLSDDARQVAFSALSATAPCLGVRIFLKDMVTGALTCADALPDGSVSVEASSFSPHLSDDGRYLVFSSYQPGLDARCDGPAGQSRNHAYVRDLATGELACLDQRDGVPSTSAVASAVSADGRFVTLYARGPGLHSAVTGDEPHGYLVENPLYAPRDP